MSLKKIPILKLNLLLIGFSLLVIIFLSGTLYTYQTGKFKSIPVLSLEAQKEEAARKGVDWIINNKDGISRQDRILYLMQIYKITSDEKLAQKLSKIILTEIHNIKIKDTLINLDDPKNLNWQITLRPIVDSLFNKKCAGKEYTNDLNNLKVLLKTHSKEIFSKDVDLSSKMIAAYILKSLGIDINNFYANTISDIKSQPYTFSEISLENQEYSTYSYLFALTHVIYSESDYYDKYLDPNNYKDIVLKLNKILDMFSAQQNFTGFSADIVPEALSSLKILHIAPDQKKDNLYKKLIISQNPDGSWGTNDEMRSAVAHHTVVAVTALLPFTSEFRKGSIQCGPKNP